MGFFSGKTELRARDILIQKMLIELDLRLRRMERTQEQTIRFVDDLNSKMYNQPNVLREKIINANGDKP